MAKNISEALINDVYRFPNLAWLHVLIKLSPIREKIRIFLRKTFPKKAFKKSISKPNTTNDFLGVAEHFQKKHWAYCDKFWDEVFHNEVIADWPKAYFFRPIRYITKSYDQGFIWTRDNELPKEMKNFTAMEKAYNYLRSEEFCNKITQITGDNIKRECYQLILTRAYEGSSVIPHIDSQNNPNNVNMIIFMNGTGGENAGGLGVWKDNEFKEKIFEPTNLKNSCLLYDMSEDFYHGFKPMRKNSFRWTIAATYSGIK